MVSECCIGILARESISWILPAILCAFVLMALGVPGDSAAGDNDAKAKEIEQLVRAAEAHTKAGEFEGSAAKLAKAEALLAELEADEPRHRAVRPMTARLGTAQKNYQEALAAGPPDNREADAAEAVAATARTDAQLMIDLYDKYYPEFDLMHGNSLVYGVKVSEAQAALDQVEAVEALLPELSPELGRLADTYGTQPLEIGKQLHDQGVKVSGDPGGRLAYLIEGMANVAKSRAASAESCVRNADMFLEAFSENVTDVYLERMNTAKELLLIGQKLDPNNTAIVDRLSKIDDQIGAAAEKMEAEIDAATWAGNIGSFPGPGDPASLAKAALGFFQGHQNWGGRQDKKIEVLQVCVRGPWQVANRDIFGRVISWRLPIHVAVTDPDLRPRDIARVYELSVLAMEGAPNNAPKSPPFAEYWVGNSWMMRLSKF